MKATKLIVSLIFISLLCSCDSHVTISFAKDFGSELTTSFQGEGVDEQFPSMEIGDTRTEFETLEGLCSEPILKRLGNGVQFSCKFKDVEQLNSMVMRSEGIEDWAMEEMEGFHNVRWADEGTLVLTKYFDEEKLIAEGPLKAFIPAVKSQMGKSTVSMDLKFEYEIDSVMVMPQIEHVLNERSVSLTTDLRTIWSDEGVLMLAVFFENEVKPD